MTTHQPPPKAPSDLTDALPHPLWFALSGLAYIVLGLTTRTFVLNWIVGPLWLVGTLWLVPLLARRLRQVRQ